VEQNGPVNLFKFVINPNDFAQSVENLFYLSFLIRDGECALEIEDDDEPVVCASPPSLTLAPLLFQIDRPVLVSFRAVICEQPQLSDYQEGLKKQQLVFEFDVKTWEVGHPVAPLENKRDQISTCDYEQEAIKVFNITEAIIPQRPKVASTNGKWYG
jgi:hypothetical protein